MAVPQPVESNPNPSTTAPQPQGAYARLKARVVALSESRHAFWAMMGVAVIDGSIFPVPPFAILVPMCLAKPKKAWAYALAGTVASLFGGLIGYALGHYIGHGVESLLHVDLNARIHRFGIDKTMAEILGQFWLLSLAASILPTPYKVVAIGSGLVHVPLEQFFAASVLGRSARFFGIGLFTAYGRQFYVQWKERRAK